MFECHITLNDKTTQRASIPNWKIQKFTNYKISKRSPTSLTVEPIRSETLLTQKMTKFDRYIDALAYYSTVAKMFDLVRFKIESDVSATRPAYYEAHYKFDGEIGYILNDFQFYTESSVLFNVSQNDMNSSWWGTVRDNNLDVIKDKHKHIMQDYRKFVTEFEIESVLIDTNRDIDNSWLG